MFPNDDPKYDPLIAHSNTAHGGGRIDPNCDTCLALIEKLVIDSVGSEEFARRAKDCPNPRLRRLSERLLERNGTSAWD